MTAEAQRIAIAEACPFVIKNSSMDNYVWKWHNETIPFNPLNDLNAMHEAETGLTDEQWFRYLKLLSGQTDADDRTWPTCYLDLEVVRKCVSATAAQREEAFLRTIGKWVESETAANT